MNVMGGPPAFVARLGAVWFAGWLLVLVQLVGFVLVLFSQRWWVTALTVAVGLVVMAGPLLLLAWNIRPPVVGRARRTRRTWARTTVVYVTGTLLLLAAEWSTGGGDTAATFTTWPLSGLCYALPAACVLLLDLRRHRRPATPPRLTPRPGRTDRDPAPEPAPDPPEQH